MLLYAFAGSLREGWGVGENMEKGWVAGRAPNLLHMLHAARTHRTPPVLERDDILPGKPVVHAAGNRKIREIRDNSGIHWG